MTTYPKTIECPDWVLLSAFRYALGRQTYIVQDTVRLLTSNAHDIKPEWRALIAQEIDDYVVTNRLSSIDRPGWLGLRDLMRGFP